jgi:hypothetical protein
MAVNVENLILKIPPAERSAFEKRVKQIASRLGVPWTHLMAIMDLESAHTFDPAIKNKYGYVGLIQFGSAAAADLGTTTSALQKMTRLQQLDYVEKYYEMWMKRLGITKLNDFVDLYLVVFYPTGVKETNPDKPFTTPKVEAANPKLVNAQGKITKNSIRAAYEKDYEGLFEKAVRIAKKNIGWIIAGLVISIILIFLAYHFMYKGEKKLSFT